jgi:predicted phosphodiesterase
VPDCESRVGIIGDTHIPFCLPGYLEFCQETFWKWDVDTFVHIGDLLDNHAISFHKPDPDGRSAGGEYESAIDALGPWYRAFPHIKWVTGNHDALPQRKIYDAGLPANMIRGNYYQAPPGWSNAESFVVDGVLYTHGIGSGGINGHRLLALKRGVSCVIGHIHMTAGVAYTSAHDGEQRFGLAVGCGIDHKSYGMAYARFFGRPALGCGVVLGGQEAHFIPWLTGRER